VSLLQNPEVYKNDHKIEMLYEIHDKSKRTLKDQMQQMLLAKEYEWVMKKYREDETLNPSKEQYTEDLIKMLLRN